MINDNRVALNAINEGVITNVAELASTETHFYWSADTSNGWQINKTDKETSVTARATETNNSGVTSRTQAEAVYATLNYI